MIDNCKLSFNMFAHFHYLRGPLSIQVNEFEATQMNLSPVKQPSSHGIDAMTTPFQPSMVTVTLKMFRIRENKIPHLD